MYIGDEGRHEALRQGAVQVQRGAREAAPESLLLLLLFAERLEPYCTVRRARACALRNSFNYIDT